MKEDFLHYIWQFQLFSHHDLRTTDRKELSVLKPGEYNTNAGPDFLNALVVISGVKWAGSVEIHIRSSDWERHHHQLDRKYENVILHVIWENDCVITHPDGSSIPALELKKRVSEEQLLRYKALVKPKPGIPCSPFFAQVPDITRWSMLDRVLHERLEQKAAQVAGLVAELRGDWEVVAYTWLFRAFGFKINAEPFERLSEALPLRILRKHQGNQAELEALLLGQAGFLEEAIDEYTRKLKQEFEYLSQKYGLAPARMKISDWNFLRLRPSNFPTVRLSQLAATLYELPHLRESLLTKHSPAEWRALFQKEPSEYWKNHFRPGIETRPRNAAMGAASVENILINAVVPLLICFGKSQGTTAYSENALAILESVAPESNNVTAIFRALGQPIKSAADSQAVLQLYRQYCLPIKCLDCNIGVRILNAHNA